MNSIRAAATPRWFPVSLMNCCFSDSQEMMCRILLLLSFSSSVSGVLSFNKPLHYEAEENSGVSVEWSFSSTAGLSISSLKIHCLLLPDLQVFYHLDHSVEEPQHRRFAGRVRCDREALTAGRVRLLLSRTRTDDSGRYLCRMVTGFGKEVREFWLNVTAAPVRTTPATETPEPAVRTLPVVAVAAGLVILVTSCCLVLHCHSV